MPVYPKTVLQEYGISRKRYAVFLYPENPAIVAGLKKGFADEKIKNKGIRSNEICACRDRRPRRSKRNGSSKCLFEQNYVRV